MMQLTVLGVLDPTGIIFILLPGWLPDAEARVNTVFPLETAVFVMVAVESDVDAILTSRTYCICNKDSNFKENRRNKGNRKTVQFSDTYLPSSNLDRL